MWSSGVDFNSLLSKTSRSCGCLLLELVTLLFVQPSHLARLSQTSSPVPSQNQSLTMNSVHIVVRDNL